MQPPPPAPPFFGISGPPGAQPADYGAGSPSAIVWFKIYAGLMAFGGLLGAGLGVFVMVFPALATRTTPLHDPSNIVAGLVYVVMGLVGLVPNFAALFLPAKRWVWTYDLVLICLGLLHCMCWPFSIPLLVAWMKPEVKAHFGA
jgi:hypothetical protein